MTCTNPPLSRADEPTVALLPGTGSDEVFVATVFAEPLHAAGMSPHALSPFDAESSTDGLLESLDALADATAGPIVVGGISFGAHLAAHWALRERTRCAGLVLALPAWTGSALDSPACLGARHSASLIEELGIEQALRTATAGVEPWLAAELRRAWRRHGSLLAPFLRAAADQPAPELEDLAKLDLPVGIGACADDPVHPASIAYEWARALPAARVLETDMAAIGRDRRALGHAAVTAFELAARR